MLIRLVRCSTLPEALAVESVLKGYGVAHVWVGREFASQRWDLIIALGGVDIMVPSEDYDNARQILDSREPLGDADRCWQSRLFWQAPISMFDALAKIRLNARGKLYANPARHPSHSVFA